MKTGGKNIQQTTQWRKKYLNLVTKNKEKKEERKKRKKETVLDHIESIWIMYFCQYLQLFTKKFDRNLLHQSMRGLYFELVYPIKFLLQQASFCVSLSAVWEDMFDACAAKRCHRMIESRHKAPNVTCAYRMAVFRSVGLQGSFCLADISQTAG